MKKYFILLVVATLILSGCQGKDSASSLVKNPFNGGKEGLIINFEPGSPPAETFDSATSAFDILVKLQNKGETFVSKDDVTVKISGFNPSDFETSDLDLVKNSPDDLIETQVDTLGRVTEGPPSFVEFTDLSHIDKVEGSTLNFPIRADVCYLYKTKAVGKLCIRENIINPLPGGVCEIAGTKTLYTSGAPVQLANLVEQARARDKIGFTFELNHPGTGNFFEKGTTCDQGDRRSQKKTWVKVETRIPGLSCTGLQSTGDGVVEGYITLFDVSRTVSCSQELPALRDFELPVRIELTYDYLQNVQTQITVKSSGQ